MPFNNFTTIGSFFAGSLALFVPSLWRAPNFPPLKQQRPPAQSRSGPCRLTCRVRVVSVNMWIITEQLWANMIYIYICISYHIISYHIIYGYDMCIYIYIHIWRERERERETLWKSCTVADRGMRHVDDAVRLVKKITGSVLTNTSYEHEKHGQWMQVASVLPCSSWIPEWWIARLL